MDFVSELISEDTCPLLAKKGDATASKIPVPHRNFSHDRPLLPSYYLIHNYLLLVLNIR